MRNVLRRRPLVSVILPSFNHAPFVAEAVGSVLDQSLRDLELIVVDDASTDATPEIVGALRDPRLTLLRLPANRAVHPRNLALSRARGRYVAFQNSDDIWRPGKLERQVEAMESRDRPAACFTRAETVDAEGRPTGGDLAEKLLSHEERPAAAWLRRFFDIGNCLIISSAMVRRSDLVALGGFRASLVQLGDFDLWVRMAALGAFRILPEPLTLWRILGEANLSHPSPTTRNRAQIELAQILEHYAAPPLLGLLDRIFPEIPADAPPGARRIALALRAVGRPGSGFSLFADRVIAAVLDDAAARAEAVAHHGTGFLRDFLARRGRSEFRQIPETELPSA
ncbi:MAG: glycosyltransferase family 2 protein [Rubritepida sp.]|nr:glycosyltransferase family 2 protein [Rubritepida sp.]